MEYNCLSYTIDKMDSEHLKAHFLAEIAKCETELVFLNELSRKKGEEECKCGEEGDSAITGYPLCARCEYLSYIERQTWEIPRARLNYYKWCLQELERK